MTVSRASVTAALAPWKPPPTKTLPPVAPLASIEVVSNSPTCWAVSAISPPRPRALEASTRVLPCKATVGAAAPEVEAGAWPPWMLTWPPAVLPAASSEALSSVTSLPAVSVMLPP